jgi:DNA-binding response OmpR family regulator
MRVSIKLNSFQPQSRSKMMAANPKTIMVVEDEPDTAEMFSEMMRLSGYRVVKSLGGMNALNLIVEEKPDAIMLDVMMPELSGLDILRFLQSNPELATIPVIVVSARSLPNDVRSGLEAGASAYLTKPVSFVELKKTVEEVLKTSGESSGS